MGIMLVLVQVDVCVDVDVFYIDVDVCFDVDVDVVKDLLPAQMSLLSDVNSRGTSWNPLKLSSGSGCR